MIKSIIEDILNKWNTFYKGIINNDKRVRRKSAVQCTKFNIENQRQNKRLCRKIKENSKHNEESLLLSKKRFKKHFKSEEDPDNCILDVFNSLINETSNKQTDIDSNNNNEINDINNNEDINNRNGKNIKGNKFNQKISKQKKINKTKKRAVILMKNTKKKIKNVDVKDIDEKLRVIKLGKRKSEAHVCSEKPKEISQVDKTCLTVKIVQALDEKENCKGNKPFQNCNEKQELCKDYSLDLNKYDTSTKNLDLNKCNCVDKNVNNNEGMNNESIYNECMNNEDINNEGMNNEGMNNEIMNNESINNEGMNNEGIYNKDINNEGINNESMNKNIIDDVKNNNKDVNKINLNNEGNNYADMEITTIKNIVDIKKKNELLKNIFKKEKSKIENKKNSVLLKNSEFMTNTKIYKPEVRLVNEKNKEVKLQEKKIYDVKSSRFLKDNDLYKKVIDSQRKGLSQNEYKSSTVIPHIKSDEEDSLLFIEPLYSKDPELNDKVCKQDHKELEKYFNLCEDINVAEIFPNIKDITNDSPNKWN